MLFSEGVDVDSAGIICRRSGSPTRCRGAPSCRCRVAPWPPVRSCRFVFRYVSSASLRKTRPCSAFHSPFCRLMYSSLQLVNGPQLQKRGFGFGPKYTTAEKAWFWFWAETDHSPKDSSGTGVGSADAQMHCLVYVSVCFLTRVCRRHLLIKPHFTPPFARFSYSTMSARPR